MTTHATATAPRLKSARERPERTDQGPRPDHALRPPVGDGNNVISAPLMEDSSQPSWKRTDRADATGSIRAERTRLTEKTWRTRHVLRILPSHSPRQQHTNPGRRCPVAPTSGPMLTLTAAACSEVRANKKNPLGLGRAPTGHMFAGKKPPKRPAWQSCFGSKPPTGKPRSAADLFWRHLHPRR